MTTEQHAIDQRSNRELRHKKLVDDTLARHGIKTKAVNTQRMERLREAAEGEAEELLDAQVPLPVGWLSNNCPAKRMLFPVCCHASVKRCE